MIWRGLISAIVIASAAFAGSADHPLRVIREIANAALKSLSDGEATGMLRWPRQIVAGCLSAVAATAWIGAASAQTLRIGLGEDPDILDPTRARTYVARIVFAALCDKLVDPLDQCRSERIE